MSIKKRGQGLSALLSSIDTELEENPQGVVTKLSGTVTEIPLSQIEVNPFQPRVDFDELALEELAESIRIHGLIQPITVRRIHDDQFQLISGERRFRASKRAGLSAVPAYIRVVDNDQTMLELALIENIQRQDLNAIEVALTYKRLMEECALTHDTLSDRVGKKRSTVTNYMRLLKLPPSVQLGIKELKISMGHARALVAIDDVALQLSLYNQILTEGLSVRQVEALATKTDAPKASGKKEQLPADYLRVQDTLTSYFGTKVAVKRSANGKGQITIPFSNDEDLNRLLELMEK